MKDESLTLNPSSAELAKLWSLDPAITFLNHGSFGACPIPVLEAQQRWRERMERQPLQFLGADIEGLLDAARAELAAFVGAEPGDLVFVPNATTGVNAVLRSLRFQPGDELLTTDQEYNACRNALNFVAEREGVQVVVAPIPFPIDSPEQVMEAVLQKVSPRTRLALLDHVVSQTGLIFPIATLVAELQQRGVDTLIDGAHAPGMVPLQLSQLGATFYTGNCHKWVCAPKGSAFLYVQRDRQSAIHPLTISHGANDPRTTRSRFHLEFDWMGTADPTAYLCVPEAIRLMQSLLPGGWPEVMERNHQLVVSARKLLCQTLSVPPPSPETMLGSLAVIPLPDGNAPLLHDHLLEHHRVEVPIVPWRQQGRLLRISAQVYNRIEQYQYLADALLRSLPVA